MCEVLRKPTEKAKSKTEKEHSDLISDSLYDGIITHDNLYKLIN